MKETLTYDKCSTLQSNCHLVITKFNDVLHLETKQLIHVEKCYITTSNETNSKELSPSCEAAKCVGTQEVPLLVNYCVITFQRYKYFFIPLVIFQTFTKIIPVLFLDPLYHVSVVYLPNIF